MERIYSGWLTKSPRQRKSAAIWKIFKSRWRRRFFVLYAPPASTMMPGMCSAVLDYYDSERLLFKKGTIDLTNCVEVKALPITDFCQYAFTLCTKHRGHDRTYHLVSESESDMKQWIEYLRAVLFIDGAFEAGREVFAHAPVSTTSSPQSNTLPAMPGDRYVRVPEHNVNTSISSSVDFSSQSAPTSPLQLESVIGSCPASFPALAGPLAPTEVEEEEDRNEPYILLEDCLSGKSEPTVTISAAVAIPKPSYNTNIRKSASTCSGGNPERVKREQRLMSEGNCKSPEYRNLDLDDNAGEELECVWDDNNNINNDDDSFCDTRGGNFDSCPGRKLYDSPRSFSHDWRLLGISESLSNGGANDFIQEMLGASNDQQSSKSCGAFPSFRHDGNALSFDLIAKRQGFFCASDDYDKNLLPNFNRQESAYDIPRGCHCQSCRPGILQWKPRSSHISTELSTMAALQSTIQGVSDNPETDMPEYENVHAIRRTLLAFGLPVALSQNVCRRECGMSNAGVTNVQCMSSGGMGYSNFNGFACSSCHDNPPIPPKLMPSNSQNGASDVVAVSDAVSPNEFSLAHYEKPIPFQRQPAAGLTLAGYSHGEVLLPKKKPGMSESSSSSDDDDDEDGDNTLGQQTSLTYEMAARLSRAVHYADLDHVNSPESPADKDSVSMHSSNAGAGTDYKEIDWIKTKALHATKNEVESKRRRSSEKSMDFY